MANPNGRKGRAWEKSCLELVSALFPYAYYGGKQGTVDKGDFVNTGEFCFEAKNHKTIKLAEWVDEARDEAVNAEARWPVVLIKRRNHADKRGYAVMELQYFLDLVEELLKHGQGE